MINKSLLVALEALFKDVSSLQLQRAAEKLSLRYRTNQNQKESFIQNKEEALAYVCTRFPATFAVNLAIYERLKKEVDVDIESFLDLGCGAFSGFFAAKQVFQEINKAIFIEKEKSLFDL